MQLGRVGKEVGADPVERLTVVQPGEDIVVALPLDALLFQHGTGHIFEQAHL